jgi:protein subunit release factor A
LGGFKEAQAAISGEEVFKRIPAHLDERGERDRAARGGGGGRGPHLKINVFRAGGAGGQSDLKIHNNQALIRRTNAR